MFSASISQSWFSSPPSARSRDPEASSPKRGVQLINGALGEAVGRVYVERHYPAESNRQMSELIANLRERGRPTDPAAADALQWTLDHEAAR